MIVVTLTCGLAGDLISAVIDSKHCTLSAGKVELPAYRKSLKKTANYTDEQKDQFMVKLSSMYKSIPSVAHKYHNDRGDNTLAIDVKDPILYKFAAERTLALHDVNEVNRMFGTLDVNSIALTIEEWNKYVVSVATNVIYFDDILNGKLIEKLQLFVDTDLDQDFYNKWLKLEPIDNWIKQWNN